MYAPSLAPAPELQETAPPAAAEAWSPARRVAFRYAFCLALLLYLPFPIGALPFTDAFETAWSKGVTGASIWLTRTLLNPPPEELPELTGSGDTLYDYVRFAVFLGLSALGAAIWSWLDRRRLHYRTLAAWLHLWVRWGLFITMASYGFHKVIPLQMPTADDARLVQPMGTMSPMGLVWSFVGASPAYEMLGGWGEAIGGLLLLWRRTSTLGALVLLGVMGNVVALNFFYDVPVKLYSAQLWLTAAFIAAPDALRLFRLLVLRRTTEPAPEVPLWPSWNRYRRVAAGLAVALAGWVVYSHVTGSLKYWTKLQEDRAKAPLSGVWQVESFSAPADAKPGSPLAGPAWARAGGSSWRIGVLRVDGSFTSIRAEVNADGTAKLSTRDFPEPAVVRVERIGADQVRFSADGGFEVRLKAIPESAFPLRARGFNWVQPLPFNR